jgi:cell division transport system permease protein
MVWLVVGIALALPAGLWLLQVNMEEMTADWEGRPGLSVYFTLSASDEAVEGVTEFLARSPDVDRSALTSAEDALIEFKNYSGLGDALELLEDNPLPDSLQAQFAEGVDGSRVDRLSQRLLELPGVAEVVVEKTWLERLNDISSVVSRLSIMLALLFGLGGVLVTASSVRLAIEARLDELRVLKLVGATAGQIRRPFLYFGMIYGFGGGVIAAMLIAITVVIIEPPMQSLLGSYDQDLNLVGFDPTFLMALLSVGSILGIMGALLAVKQRLSGLEIF